MGTRPRWEWNILTVNEQSWTNAPPRRQAEADDQEDDDD